MGEFSLSVSCTVHLRFSGFLLAARACLLLWHTYLRMYKCALWPSGINCTMYVCIYVCIDGWMYIRTYVYMCICICMYVCVCMYACIYVGICVCMYVCTYVCVCVCMYVCTYVCMYVCMYIWMDGWMYIRTYVQMCICMCMYVRMCMYVCMYVSMYVCMYACIYACMCVCKCVCRYVLYIQYACMYSMHACTFICMYNGWMNVSLACTVYFAQVPMCCIHLKSAGHCLYSWNRTVVSFYTCVSYPIQTDRAVQLLLETESTHPCYYSDSLKACLATAIGCNATSQSTVKLVSTNLIANGKLIGQFVWSWDLHVNSISHTFGCPLNGWQFPNCHTFPHSLQ